PAAAASGDPALHAPDALPADGPALLRGLQGRRGRALRVGGGARARLRRAAPAPGPGRARRAHQDHRPRPPPLPATRPLGVPEVLTPPRGRPATRQRLGNRRSLTLPA